MDLEFLFAQVLIDEARVDTTPNCGNMLAAVGPFGLERGLIPARGAETTVRILTRNTGMLSRRHPPDAGRPHHVRRFGPHRRRARHVRPDPHQLPRNRGLGVRIAAADRATSSTRSTACPVTCIDNGMPVVVIRAADLGRTGYETRDALNADAELKARIESIRLQAGPAMNLGDVTKKVVPKMSLIAPPRAGGALCSRTFIPHDCHSAVGVLGAVTLATAAVLPGSVADGVAVLPAGHRKAVSVEHPTGEFTVELELDPAAPAERASGRAAAHRAAHHARRSVDSARGVGRPLSAPARGVDDSARPGDDQRKAATA